MVIRNVINEQIVKQSISFYNAYAGIARLSSSLHAACSDHACITVSILLFHGNP